MEGIYFVYVSILDLSYFSEGNFLQDTLLYLN